MNQLKNDIPSITNLVTTAALYTKINEIKNKIPNITNLATTTALTAAENIIPDHSKYISTPEFSKLTAENIVVGLAQVYKKLLQIKQNMYLLNYELNKLKENVRNFQKLK